MRPLLLALVASTALCAQSDADLAAIRAAFQTGLVFTGGGQQDWDRLRPAFPGTPTPMSEVTTPNLVLRRIRFLTSRVGFADATLVQFGSLIVSKRIPIVLVFVKFGTEWRVDLVRLVQ